MKKKIFCFDIDNTVCTTKGTNYRKARPKKKVIKLINNLYMKGNTIIFFTARFMGRNNNNIQKAYKQGYKFTKNQLISWDIKFHKLIMGKPSFDILVDDKSINFKRDWYKKLENKSNFF